MQFKYIPLENWVKRFPNDPMPEGACVCKKPECKRVFDMMPPRGKPGPKPTKVAKLNQPEVAVAVNTSTLIPEGYKVMEVKEIWGVRYGGPAHTLALLMCIVHTDRGSPQPCSQTAGIATSRR